MEQRQYDPERIQMIRQAMQDSYGHDWEEKLVGAISDALQESMEEFAQEQGTTLKELFGDDHPIPKFTSTANGMEEFYPDGTLKRQLLYRQNKAIHTLSEFSPAGHLTSRHTFSEKNTPEKIELFANNVLVKTTSFNEDGIPHGEYAEFSPETGHPIVQRLLQMGRIAKEVRFHPNGQPHVESTFNTEQELIGKRVEYYPSGLPKKEEMFVKNKLNGESLLYNEKNVLIRKANFVENKPDGDFIIYDDKGVLSEQKKFKAGVLHGVSTAFYPDGTTPKDIKTFADGELNGQYATFYENGQPQQQMTMRDGKPHGEIKRFDMQGRPTLVGTMVNGNLHGKVLAFSKGVPTLECEYKQGKKDGQYTAFYKGSPRVTGFYKNNLRDGKETAFYDDGKIARICHYKEGEYHGPMMSFGMKGELLGEQMFVEGLPSGKVVRYYPDGSPQEVQEFKHGKPHGSKIEYKPKGKRQKQIVFREGEMVGKPILYNRLGLPTIGSFFAWLRTIIDYLAQWLGFSLRGLIDWVLSLFRR